MTIDVAGVPGALIAEYGAVSIAFEVRSALVAHRAAAGETFVLTEAPVDPPYVKDYDAIGDRPGDWAARFDTSRWVMLLARAGSECLGGAAVAIRTPGLELLEGRSDLAVLWDIRVAPASRGQGVGRTLFEAAETWAHAHGCGELKVETQNINLAACRFYERMGCALRVVRENAYPQCPGEAQFLWYKPLMAARAAGLPQDP